MALLSLRFKKYVISSDNRALNIWAKDILISQEVNVAFLMETDIN